MSIWFSLLYQPLVNFLILFYRILGHNLGLAIIGLTVAIRAALIPLTQPSLKAAQEMKKVAPELEKLKIKYKNDKQALAQAQLKLYKEKGINPAAGCLPQIIQFIILIALYQAFSQVLNTDGEIMEKLNSILYPFLKFGEEEVIKTKFLYLNLTQPDLINLPFSFKFFGATINKLPGIFLILAAVSQFISSKTMMPVSQVQEEQAKKTPQKEDDMGAMMQKQMLYTMPLITLFIGFKFPSGLVLYWLTFSLFMAYQQFLVNKKK